MSDPDVILEDLQEKTLNFINIILNSNDPRANNIRMKLSFMMFFTIFLIWFGFKTSKKLITGKR